MEGADYVGIWGEKARSGNELKAFIPDITHKILVNQLRELEQNLIVHRVVAPKAEYSLISRGESYAILDAMYERRKENLIKRSVYIEGFFCGLLRSYCEQLYVLFRFLRCQSDDQ